MAKTTFSTSNALTKKAWEEKLFRDTVKESYFDRFMGGSDAIVQTNTKLTGDQGDKVTFGIRMKLNGSGVTSGMTLEGNEESLVTYDSSVTLERYRHAVRDKGALDRQRAMFSIDSESTAALKEWGSEKIDSLCFDALDANVANRRYFYRVAGVNSTTATEATASGAITAADKLTPSLISYVKSWALTGGNRSQVPLRPVKIGGKNYFVLLVHPDVMYDLKQDSTFNQARREALERGKENPLFTGSEAIWDGVVIHEHENIDISTTMGAGTIAGAKCHLLGAQSLIWAWGQRPEIISENFDYDEEHGYAWSMTAAVAKPVFNSKDYGSVSVYVARTQIADA